MRTERPVAESEEVKMAPRSIMKTTSYKEERAPVETQIAVPDSEEEIDFKIKKQKSKISSKKGCEYCQVNDSHNPSYMYHDLGNCPHILKKILRASKMQQEEEVLPKTLSPYSDGRFEAKFELKPAYIAMSNQAALGQGLQEPSLSMPKH